MWKEGRLAFLESGERTTSSLAMGDRCLGLRAGNMEYHYQSHKQGRVSKGTHRRGRREGVPALLWDSTVWPTHI